MTRLLAYAFALLFLVMCLGATHSTQGTQEHWVVTWSSASLQYTSPPFWQFGDPTVDRVMSTGVLENQTIRMMVRTTIGGRQVRIKLSNLFGQKPLHIGAARLALFPAALEEPVDGPTTPGTDRPLLFGGSPAVTIPPGQTIYSDAADLVVRPAAKVSVTLYVPDQSPAMTMQYPGVLAAAISGRGDFSEQAQIRGMRFGTHAWLASLDVLAPADASAIVIVSDQTNSIVSEQSWATRLAGRLRSNPSTEHISVVTQAHETEFNFVDFGRGVKSLDRLERDVLSQSGVRWIVLQPFARELEFSSRPNNAFPKIYTMDDYSKTFKSIIEKAHAAGVKVIGCTVPPASMAYGDDKRQELNRWIRASGVFDAVIDIDATLRDRDNPERMRSEFATGFRAAFADNVDLTLFESR